MRRLVIILASLSTLAYGEESPERPPQKPERGPQGRPEHRYLRAKIFSRLDSDKNGLISFEEFQSNPRLARASDEQRKQLFQRLDKDGDGQLAMAELARPPYRKGDWLKKGPVNYEEFAKQPRLKDVPEERRRALFQRMDRNGDGVLSHHDFPKPGRARDERGKTRRLPKPEDIDRDHDGKISFEEFRQAHPHRNLGEDEAEDRFEALDKNSDGVLTAEELPIPPALGHLAVH